MMFNIEEAARKNTKALLICTFCMLVLVKALLSLKFPSPWMMPDEAAYAKMAGDIFGPIYSELSRGYPSLLSIAYLSSNNMKIVYHSMLIINCFLSSMILFPSYFILNKYCSKDFAFIGAITISTLPSLTIYSFLIMTENLFVPIFIFSIWFLLEAYETKKLIWIFLTIFSISLLFFTRHNGIFSVISILVSVFYYILHNRKSYNIRQTILKNSTKVLFLLFVAIFLAISGAILSRSNGQYYINWIYDRINTDGQTFLTIFADVNQLRVFLALLQNEIGYIILTTYFIFLFLSIIFFLNIFLPVNRSGFSQVIRGWYQSLSVEKRYSLKATSVYYLLNSAFLVFATTMSTYHMNWEIIGRYIDPIIPGFFLIGFIVLYQIHEALDKKDIGLIAISCIMFSAIFFINFPTTLLPDIVTVFYINFLTKIAPNWIIFPALAAGFFLLLNIYINFKKCRPIFFAAIIIFSICASAYTYQADLSLRSEANQAQNQIGDYLNLHSNNDDLPIFRDEEDSDWYFASITTFWTKKDITDCPINKTLSDLKKDKKNAYLITSKVLPLEPLAVSSRGFYLYRL
jgi:hypothetical protein